MTKKELEKLYKKSKETNPWGKTNYRLAKEMNPFFLFNKNVFLSNKKMSQIDISNIEKSVLCGTCLGDSSLKINKGYKNARIQCKHSIKQASWFFWKWTVCLKDFSNCLDSITLQKPDGKQVKNTYETWGKLKITTCANERLTQLYNIICNKNKIEIKRKWLNHMNNYFLMTLWLDDGSLYNKRQGVFCLDSIPYQQQLILCKYLKNVWQIQCHVKQTNIKLSNGKMSYRLFISNQESLLKLLKLIAPIIPVREMLYKIMFVPKNNINLLQRWTSEIIALVPNEFKQTLKQDYEQILFKETQKKI